MVVVEDCLEKMEVYDLGAHIETNVLESCLSKGMQQNHHKRGAMLAIHANLLLAPKQEQNSH